MTVIDPSESIDTVVVNHPANPTTTLTSLWVETYTTTLTETHGVGEADFVIVMYPPNPTLTTYEF